MDERKFLGNWRIVSWENEDEDGQIDRPVGNDPEGFLNYGEDGRMMVQIAASGRARMSTGELFGGDVGECAAAFASYVAYGGPWRVRDGRMVHTLEIASIPNWTGGEQIRDYEFLDDGILQLSAQMRLGGRTVMARVRWRRV